MSGARTNADHVPVQENEADERPDHATNAQWLKDNPDAMPQVSAGRWAVYDRQGQLCGHLVGNGPTLDTRFKATAHLPGPPDSFGITLHDAGAHLLDAAGLGTPLA
ncbi:hypothetical protein [Acrocarpospora sp. B8E8]|uniref:hypothetical protein n=1 Tax=Acrocarpospora sp. B8E8 TaxID=3153572 RepID=UPI00325E3630